MGALGPATVSVGPSSNCEGGPGAFSASRKQALPSRGHLALWGAAGEKNEIAGGNKDVKVKQTDHKQQDGYKFHAVISVHDEWQ